MITGTRGVSAIVLAILVLAAPAVAQHHTLESLGTGIAWRVTREVQEGTISGLVLTGAGRPLEGALISLNGSGKAMSDSDGAFSVKPDNGGDWEIRVRYIGYVGAVGTVTVPWDHGIFVTAILQPSSLLCGLVVCGGTVCGDLDIQIIDSNTGRVPEATVTVRAEHEGGIAMTNTVVLHGGSPHDGRIGLGRRVEPDGIYTISVTAEGYETWRTEGVDLRQVPGCASRLLNGSHVARLVPLD